MYIIIIDHRSTEEQSTESRLQLVWPWSLRTMLSSQCIENNAVKKSFILTTISGLKFVVMRDLPEVHSTPKNRNERFKTMSKAGLKLEYTP